MEEEVDEQFMVSMLGNTNVGKSGTITLHYITYIHYLSNPLPVALVQSFKAEESMVGKTMPTVGYDFCAKMVDIEGIRAKVILNDTSGSERFFSITKNYIRQGDGLLVVFDVTKRDSFDAVEKWIERIQEIRPDEPAIVIVGNKVDLTEERQVTSEEGLELAKKFRAEYCETSCKDIASVSQAFLTLARQIHSNILFRTVKDKKSRESTVLSRRQDSRHEIMSNCRC